MRIINDSYKRITQSYGMQLNGTFHNGVDLGWRKDENENKVFSNCQGIVVEVQDGLENSLGTTGTKSWGNYVLIKHENGYHSRYAHLKKGVFVKKGQEVDENTVIGIIGNSGNAYGRHLHFEVSKTSNSNTRIDPIPYLTKAIFSRIFYEKKTIDELALEVIQGKWGNGKERIQKITEAGYDYDKIQNKVNIMLNDNKKVILVHTVTPGETISSIARKYNTDWNKIYEKNQQVIENIARKHGITSDFENYIYPGEELIV